MVINVEMVKLILLDGLIAGIVLSKNDIKLNSKVIAIFFLF